MQRRRSAYLGAAAAVIVLGLLTRSSVSPLSWPVKKYGADALWALLIFLILAVAKPRWSSWWLGSLSFAFSVAVEFSQLYHAPWIDALRGTPLGALVLGRVFNWPDIPAYALGIGVGVLLDWSFIRLRRT